MSDPTDAEPDNDLLAALRDVEEVSAELRARHIAIAVDHLSDVVDDDPHSARSTRRLRLLGVAAAVVVVIGTTAVVARIAVGENDSSEKAATVTDAAEGAGAAPASTASAASTTSYPPPSLRSEAATALPAHLVDLGSFPDSGSARLAALAAATTQRESSAAVDAAAAAPSPMSPTCQVPAEYGTPTWWGLATIDGSPWIVAVVEPPGSQPRALIRKMDACAWS